jgi:hypothetical protein
LGTSRKANNCTPVGAHEDGHACMHAEAYESQMEASFNMTHISFYVPNILAGTPTISARAKGNIINNGHDRRARFKARKGVS